MRNEIRIALCVIAVTVLATGCERGSSTTENAAQVQGSTMVPGGDSGQRKILHYRDPMGGAGTSATPKKDAMGMDYIPVYADGKP